MSNKEFIEKYPLQYSLPAKESEALRKLLKKANETYVLEVKEEKGVRVGRLQYTDFTITCPTTSFASAYAHVGLLYSEKVLPIWKKRHKK